MSGVNKTLLQNRRILSANRLFRLRDQIPEYTRIIH